MAARQALLAMVVVRMVVVVVLPRGCSRRDGGGCCGGIIAAITKGPAAQLLDPGLRGFRILEDVITHAAGVIRMRGSHCCGSHCILWLVSWLKALYELLSWASWFADYPLWLLHLNTFLGVNELNRRSPIFKTFRNSSSMCVLFFCLWLKQSIWKTFILRSPLLRFLTFVSFVLSFAGLSLKYLLSSTLYLSLSCYFLFMTLTFTVVRRCFWRLRCWRRCRPVVWHVFWMNSLFEGFFDVGWGNVAIIIFYSIFAISFMFSLALSVTQFP